VNEIRSEREWWWRIKGEGREGEAPEKKFLSSPMIDGMPFVSGLFFIMYKFSTFMPGGGSTRYKCEADTFAPSGAPTWYKYEAFVPGWEEEAPIVPL
jgi:hypothetical protein